MSLSFHFYGGGGGGGGGGGDGDDDDNVIIIISHSAIMVYSCVCIMLLLLWYCCGIVMCVLFAAHYFPRSGWPHQGMECTVFNITSHHSQILWAMGTKIPPHFFENK